MWLGLGLSLDRFRKLEPNERRRRFCELSDVDQLLFVERHLDSVTAVLQGYPPEDMLPERPPPGYRSPDGVVIPFPHDLHASPETPQ